MDNFIERHHAFISATYYKLLKEGEYPNYRRVFIMATQRMAEQRGSRMAQRAIRDGVEELDFAAYRHYGEWEWTKEYLDSIKGQKHIEITECGKDYAYDVYTCPWADVYKEEGLEMDGGIDYCYDLDPSIARGFNPHLKFILSQPLSGHDKCIQRQVNASTDKDDLYGPKKPENIMGFDYQCGNVYKTFSDYMVAIYKADGVILNAKVLEVFAEKHGKDMADVLVSYLDTDFNVI